MGRSELHGGGLLYFPAEHYRCILVGALYYFRGLFRKPSNLAKGETFHGRNQNRDHHACPGLV